MKPKEFFKKYYFHDSGIEKVEYNQDTKELLFRIDFCFWMQQDYVKGTPENGMINVHCHDVDYYDGLIGEFDWISIISIHINRNKTISITVIDEIQHEFFDWTFSSNDIEFEDLHIDTTSA